MASPQLRLTLQRIVDNGKCTLGRLALPSGFVVSTIERPWVQNKKGISCIPAGDYTCVMTLSNRFKKKLYILLEVPNRSGIRIHAANWAHQLEGCIALGISHGPEMVSQSQVAMHRFHEELDGRKFTLHIADPVD